MTSFDSEKKVSVNRKKIECYKCRNFYITWEKNTPYGCKGHGFKAAQIPSVVVFSSSGIDCLLFNSKS